jgi:hypothetical protein
LQALRNLYVIGLLVLFTVPSLAQNPPAPAPPPKPAPDVLIFTNGDQLTGHLVRAVSGNVVFNSDMAGEITVSLDKVKELRSGSAFAALRKGPPSKTNLVAQGNVSVADNSITVTPANAPPATLPIKDLGYLVDWPTYDREVNHRVPFLQGWNGALTGGVTLVRSTDKSTSLTAGITLVRAEPTVDYLPKRNRTTFNLIETYGTSTSPVIPQTVPPSPSPVIVETNIFHADAERDEYFSPTVYALADTAFDHNFSQGLSLQQIYGGGIGWTPIQTARQQVDLKADVHYERQNFFASSNNEDLIGSTFAENYRRNLPRKLLFTEFGNYIPAWNNTNAYSANVGVALALPVWKRLAASLSSTDNYLNNPSPGYKKNSFQFVTGVTYTLK